MASKPIELLTGSHSILLETSAGAIKLSIDADAAPKAATNFVLHSRNGYYDGLTFHRVIDDFMIQGGDPEGSGRGGRSVFGRPFEDEQNSFAMERGVIAMANSGPNTNGSQFFIIQSRRGAPHLRGKHTAFGRVTEGIEVVDAIASVQTGPGDCPLVPVTFTPREL